MRVFRDQSFHGSITFDRDGFKADYPAFLYEGHTVWGLTYRMIRGFLDTVAAGDDGPVEAGVVAGVRSAAGA